MQKITLDLKPSEQMFSRRMKPVSYTHLDVYKRQSRPQRTRLFVSNGVPANTPTKSRAAK